MPEYTHEDVTARFPDELVGMSISTLLTNQGTFHVKVSSVGRGELFTFLSPQFHMKLVINDGFVEFHRNTYIARKEIGSVKRHFQILISWKPGLFQLSLIVDDKTSIDGTLTIETDPIFVPVSALDWARRFNLLPRSTYNSPAEFLGVFIESLRQTERAIRDANSYKLFWDRQKGVDEEPKLIPKREPEAMSGLAAFLQDQSLLSGFQLIQESVAGSGTLDLRAIATLGSGGFVNVCVEGKNAHSNDLKHGITDQLPSYMRSNGADYGVYLVLWYQCDEFQKPSSSETDVTWELTKLRPWKTIVVEKFNLALPISPSVRSYKYV